jgi:N-acetylglucosaminyl-diphospho-decaprenol L-rhamnosyltransferase
VALIPEKGGENVMTTQKSSMQPHPDRPHHNDGPTVAVIVVNYNTGHLVKDTVQILSEIRARWPGLTLVVVDNASPDQSGQALSEQLAAEGHSDWAQVLLHNSNAGFATGNNLGVQRAMMNARPDHFFFLNPDTRVEPDVFDVLLAESARRGDQAVLGCTLTDEQHRTRPSAFRFPSLLSEFQRSASVGLLDRWWPERIVAMPVQTQAHTADWVTGAAFFMPRAIVERAGPMDEGYFLYYEEVDYMHKVRDLGIEIWSLPQARVMHIAGAATGIVGGKSTTRKMPLYWYASWRRYFTKYHGPLGAWACGLAWLLGVGINAALAPLSARRRTTGGPAALDFFKHALLGRPAPRP